MRILPNKMTTTLIILFTLASFILLAVLGGLIFLNWGERIKAPMIPILLVAAGTIVTTIFSNLKEIKSDDFFFTNTFIDSQSYKPVNSKTNEIKLTGRNELYYYWSNNNNSEIDQSGEILYNKFKPLSNKQEWIQFNQEAVVYHILQSIIMLSYQGSAVSVTSDHSYELTKIKLPEDTGIIHSSDINIDFKAFRFYKVNLFKFKMPGEKYERDYVINNLPEGTQVSMYSNKQPNETVLRLYKPWYFEIKFTVSNLGSPIADTTNLLFNRFALKNKKVNILLFKTSLSATYYKWSSAGDKSTAYQSWGNSIFDAVKYYFDDSSKTQ